MIKNPSAKKTYRSQHGTFNFYLFYNGSIIIPIINMIGFSIPMSFTLSFEFIHQPSTKPFFYAKLHWQNMFNRFEVREIWQKIHNTWTCLCTSPSDHFYNQAPLFSFLGIQRHMCNSSIASDHRLLTVI